MSVVVDGVASSFGAIVSFVSSFVMILVTVPFIVFYMFKDGHKFVESSGRFFPAGIRSEAKQIIKEMNKPFLLILVHKRLIVCLLVYLLSLVI